MKVPYHAPDPYDDYDGCEDEPKQPFIVRFFKTAAFYIVVVAVCLFVNFFVVRLGLVNGDSMEPTLSEQDVVIIWQAFYQPHRGDIIVTSDENELGLSLTKRVVATAGQTIVIEDGTVYINGAPLVEDYLMEQPVPTAPVSMTVPPGCVFVMGDNRNNSYDSREMGCLPEAEIMGRVVLRIWPLNHIQAMESAEYPA